MKIVHIITSLKIGGAESALCNFLESLKSTSDKHFVICFYDGSNKKKIESMGFPVFLIKGLFFRYDFFLLLKLNKLLNRINPDIVHSSLWSANLFAKFVCKVKRIPIVCSLHSDFRHDGKLRKILELPSLFWANKYIAVSDKVNQGFIETFKLKKKCLQKKVVVIRNGIDAYKVRTSGFKKKLERKDFGLSKKDFIFGTVGRLESIKSYDLLIKSFYLFFKKNSNFKNKAKSKLCLVGGGSQMGYLQNLVSDLGLTDYIFFFGEQTNSKRFYQIFDCFVISSKSEGLSISLLEALSFGLPVITTSHTINHEVIVNQVNGLVVPSGDEVAISNAMDKFFFNKDFCRAVSKSNLELVKKSFSIDKMIESYSKIYKNLFLEN